MPQKSGPRQRQMCGPNRKSNQIRIQRVSRVLPKKLSIGWKQAGIQDLQNPGKVDLRIFRIRMITMNQKRNGGQQRQSSDTFDVQSVIRPFRDVSKELQQKISAAGSWGSGKSES